MKVNLFQLSELNRNDNVETTTPVSESPWICPWTSSFLSSLGEIVSYCKMRLVELGMIRKLLFLVQYTHVSANKPSLLEVVKLCLLQICLTIHYKFIWYFRICFLYSLNETLNTEDKCFIWRWTIRGSTCRSTSLAKETCRGWCWALITSTIGSNLPS